MRKNKKVALTISNQKHGSIIIDQSEVLIPETSMVETTSERVPNCEIFFEDGHDIRACNNR